MTYIYKGETFSSMAAISKEFGVPVSTLSKRLKDGKTLSQAIEMKSKTKGIKVKYNGEEYPSIRKLALSLNIRPEYIYGRTRAGMSVEDAIEEIKHLIDNNKLRDNLNQQSEDSDFKIWNQNFNSISEIEKEYEMKTGLLKEGMDNESIEKVIIEYMKPIVKKNSIKYKTVSALAGHYGLQPDNVHQRLKKGWNLTEAVIVPVQKRHGVKLTYKGNQYSSRAELASAYNIDNYYVAELSEKLGNSWMNAFEMIEKFISENKLSELESKPDIIGSQYEIIYDGVWFKKVDDLLSKYAINKWKYISKESHKRLDYLKEVLGNPSGKCFNYRHEWLSMLG